jgi:UDP-GlcNAc:undecaprenyl-phosphate/decaprenyl-phosphate GlcNAc-1-phosphate transferase
MISAAPVAAATSTLVITAVLVRLAPAMGLLDLPDHRKQHEGAVPLVGGLAIGLAYVITSILLLPEPLMIPVVYAGILLLLIIGAIDDRIPLKPRARLIAQTAVTLVLVLFGGTQLTSFGDLFGFGEITLSATTGVLFTVFFIVSLINGFNMLDGLDGLAGGVGVIILSALCAVAVTLNITSFFAHMVILLGALISFLVVHNIQSPLRFRLVFLGDAGSMVLGFLLAWSAIKISEHPGGSVYPITFVWIFGLVVLDTISTVIRRMVQRRRPLSPGTDHLHHLLLQSGLSVRQTVWVMHSTSAIMAAAGVAGWAFGLAEFWLTISFIVLSAGYYAGVAAGWRRVALRASMTPLTSAAEQACAVSEKRRRSRHAVSEHSLYSEALRVGVGALGCSAEHRRGIEDGTINAHALHRGAVGSPDQHRAGSTTTDPTRHVLLQ